MKYGYIIIAALVALLGIYFLLFRKSHTETAQQDPVAQKVASRSNDFYQKTDELLTQLGALQEAFVQADTGRVKSQVRLFIQKLDAIDSASFEKDTANIKQAVGTTVNDIRSNAASMLNQTDITEMRRDLKSMTEVMYPAFFQLINYPGKVYFFNCPMAFNDTEEANWISQQPIKRNPYLGINHPTHKNTMLQCGMLVDSLPQN
jgi:hypothetical protein